MFLQIQGDEVTKMIDMNEIASIDVDWKNNKIYLYTAYCSDDQYYETLSANYGKQTNELYNLIVNMWAGFVCLPQNVMTVDCRNGGFYMTYGLNVESEGKNNGISWK